MKRYQYIRFPATDNHYVIEYLKDQNEIKVISCGPLSSPSSSLHINEVVQTYLDQYEIIQQSDDLRDLFVYCL